MTDQDQDEPQDPTKIGIEKAADEPTDVEGHAGRTTRVAEDDDVEGHFSSVRSTRTKGD